MTGVLSADTCAAARPRSAAWAAIFSLLLGPIGMLYSTLLGCVTMLLGGGLLAVAYVAYDNPWDTSRYGFAEQHRILAPPLYAAIALYWISCAVWAAIAADRSNLHRSRLHRLSESERR